MVGVFSEPPIEGYQISVTRVRGPALPPGAGFTTSPALGLVSVQVTVLRPIPVGRSRGSVVVVSGAGFLVEGLPPPMSETIPTSTAMTRRATMATPRRRRR